MLSAPGAELILPVIAPRPVLTAGNKLRSWFSAAGIQSPRGAEMWSAYSSLADSETRQAFLRTLRSVVDHRGQAVSALNRLHLTSELPTMVIWGDQDRIIPVEHGYAVHEARPGSRLEVLAGVGHFPHVERPERRGGSDRRLHQHHGSADGRAAPPHQSVTAVKHRGHQKIDEVGDVGAVPCAGDRPLEQRRVHERDRRGVRNHEHDQRDGGVESVGRFLGGVDARPATDTQRASR